MLGKTIFRICCILKMFHASILLRWLSATLFFNYGLCFNVDKSQFINNYNNIVNSGNAESDEVLKFPLLMPNVTTTDADAYICTPVKIISDTFYIIGYEPKATMHKAHHILLYGCNQPGTEDEIWNCGEMAKESTKKSANPCGYGTTEIIYAWARDAPKLMLPNGVGFKVGRNSTIKYLVLQVHYAVAIETADESGILLHYTRQPINKLAGVLVMGTGGMIPPQSTEHMETACQIEEHKVIYPFAYRTHTHLLGKLVEGFRVRTDDQGEQNWLLLGERDPLTPQMFYPIEHRESILFGDHIAARCTMVSKRNRTTYVGPTAQHEMCNFYLMYYVENDEPLSTKYCFSEGPPQYRWNATYTDLRNLPPPRAVI